MFSEALLLLAMGVLPPERGDEPVELGPPGLEKLLDASRPLVLPLVPMLLGRRRVVDVLVVVVIGVTRFAAVD